MTDFDALATLDRGDLIRLADLLEAGLIAAPPESLALRDHFSADDCETLARLLHDQPFRDLAARQTGLVLRAFAAGYRTGEATSPSVNVVVSGPDAAAAGRDTGVVIRQMFARARRRVLAAGFAIYQGKSIFEVLAHKLDEDDRLEATLCVDVRRPNGDTSLESQIVARFAQNFVTNEWPGYRRPEVYYDPRSLDRSDHTTSAMHAKCVVIDGEEALVTSANFTEAAQVRNIELGLQVASSVVARRIEEHFEALIRNNHLKRLPLA